MIDVAVQQDVDATITVPNARLGDLADALFSEGPDRSLIPTGGISALLTSPKCVRS